MEGWRDGGGVQESQAACRGPCAPLLQEDTTNRTRISFILQKQRFNSILYNFPLLKVGVHQSLAFGVIWDDMGFLGPMPISILGAKKKLISDISAYI